jgi:hypothetical protein
MLLLWHPAVEYLLVFVPQEYVLVDLLFAVDMVLSVMSRHVRRC